MNSDLSTGIYKICILNNNKIILFLGSNKGNKNDLKKYLTSEESSLYDSKKLEVLTSSQTIHIDDSVLTIKIKILIELKFSYALSELYLFSQVEEYLNSMQVYQSLTPKKQKVISKKTLNQYLTNIIYDHNGKPYKINLDEDYYNYNDISSLNIDGYFIIDKTLGQKYILNDKLVNYIANPFKINASNSNIDSFDHKSISTYNHSLLLNNGNIKNNTIFLCTAQNVLNYFDKNPSLGVHSSDLVKIYYPYLFKENITNLSELNNKKQFLLEKDNEIKNSNIVTNFNSIDLFYSIFNKNSNQLDFLQKGIKFIRFAINPYFKVKIPLEPIFKLTNSTKNMPLVKYNISNKQENIYRLFSNNISTDGRLIPYLKKSTIFKLVRNMGKQKSVSFYVLVDKNTTFILEIYPSSIIEVSINLNNPVILKDIENIVTTHLSPIIHNIQNSIENTGFKFSQFKSFFDDNIDILQINYKYSLFIKKSFDLSKFSGCVSNIFVIEKSSKYEQLLRFKRVSNYNIKTSIEAFILEKSEQKMRGGDIVLALLENFKNEISQEEAKDLVYKMANEMQVEKTAHKSISKVKENPGFKTIINIDPQEGILNIQIENINDIFYLATIPIYIESIIQLTQFTKNLGVPLTTIKTLCGQRFSSIDIPVEDIVATSERSNKENSQSLDSMSSELPDNFDEIQNNESIEKVNFQVVRQNPTGAIDLFLDDEDDDEDSDEQESLINDEILTSQKGGIDSNSDSSLSSYKDSSTPEDVIHLSDANKSIKSLSDIKNNLKDDIVILSESKLEEISNNNFIVPNAEKPQSVSEVLETIDSVSESDLESESSPEDDNALSSINDSKSLSSKPIKKISSGKIILSNEKNELPLLTQKEVIEQVEEEEEESLPSHSLSLSPKTENNTVIENDVQEIIQDEEAETVLDKDINNIIQSEEQSEEKESDSESDEEQSEEESDSESEEEDSIRNIDGMKLKKPNYFQSLIEKKDPLLILKEDTGKYNSYSRTCKIKRKPVILTDKQLEKINNEHKGFLRKEDVVRYGSNPKKQFNYICPRFWCLKNNTLVDPKDFKKVKSPSGKIELVHPTCGKIIDPNDKVVKPGHYVYEMYDDKPVKATNNNVSIGTEVEVAQPDGPEEGKVIEINKSNKENTYKIKLNNGDIKELSLKDFKVIYKLYPNFQVGKHPDGYCIPCCFDKYNTEGRIKAKEYCEKQMRDGNIEEPSKIESIKSQKLPTNESNEERKDIDTNDLEKSEEKELEEEKKLIEEQIRSKLETKNLEDLEYIKGPEKFPLDVGRWGYLPPELELFFKQPNISCQISKTNSNLKADYPCLLRHGVEANSNQSFIACISDALYFARRQQIGEEFYTMKIQSIVEMKNTILDSISIDNFIKYQNGNLVVDFYNPETKVDMKPYKNSLLFKNVNPNNEKEIFYFQKVVNAYVHFQEFLKDNDINIDYKYLWDIVSMPNSNLFPTGINLVILELDNNDITNNVNIICPTNHYSNQMYDSRKPTLMIVKEENYFEPLYSYKTGRKIVINKFFKELDPNLSPNIRDIFKEVIKPFYKTICNPKKSIPNEFRAKTPILLSDLFSILPIIGFKVKKLIMNFNNKIIGVYLTKKDVENSNIFVPCYPSALDIIDMSENNMEITFMTDNSIWTDYVTTMNLLNYINDKISKKKNLPKVNCKPAFNVMEDELIIGILTESNIFIQVNPPYVLEKSNNKMPIIKNINYVIKDKLGAYHSPDSIIETDETIDIERVDMMKRIKLENNFYQIFRNTVKILLGDYKNTSVKEKIEGLSKNKFVSYEEKLKTIQKLIEELVGNKVLFIGDENYYKKIDEVHSCILSDVNNCNNKIMCKVNDNNECSLIIPRINLINQLENQKIYYNKLADEITRYTRIKSFMFDPKKYLNIGDVDYKINNNEIILIQSMLTQEYFINLEPGKNSKYSKFISYDEINPIKSLIYDNKVSNESNDVINNKNQISGEEEKINCKTEESNKIKGTWEKYMKNKDGFTERSYDNTISCTYSIFIDIYNEFLGSKIKINDIKILLVKEYYRLFPSFGDKIIDIFIEEGKVTIGQKLKKKLVNIQEAILDSNYFLTTIDYLILSNFYKIPVVFLSSVSIPYVISKKIMVSYFNREDKELCFLIVPGLRGNTKPSYKLILHNGKIKINTNNLDKKMQEEIFIAIENKIDLEPFLTNMVRFKPKVKKLLIEDD